MIGAVERIINKLVAKAQDIYENIEDNRTNGIKKDRVLTTRVSADTYTEIQMWMHDDVGNEIAKESEVVRALIETGKFVAVDSTVEQYKAFIASRVSNNINQIARQLNLAAKIGAVNNELALELLLEVKDLKMEVIELTAPLKKV
jgi:hypothetical protein